MLGVAGWLVLAVGCWRERGRFLEALLGFPLTFLLVWCGLGQRLTDLPTYLAASNEIASGYAEAMAADGGIWRRVAAYVLLLLLATLTFSLWRTPLWRGRRLAALGLLALAVLLEWRHGFVRQQSHDYLFFNYCRLLPFAVIALAGVNPMGWWRLSLTAVVVALAWGLWGFPQDLWVRPLSAATNLRLLFAPEAHRQRCQARRETLAAMRALPKLTARIGEESVDLISTDQATVFFNGLRYQPRPVFQSYSAYTPRLLADNAAFFESERAPRFILCRLGPIDEHFPASEDGPALLVLLRRYRPVAAEADYVLWERRSESAASSERRRLWEGEVAFWDQVPLGPALSGGLRVLTVRIDDTPRGRLEKLFGQPPPLYLRVWCGDQSKRYRLLPALAGAGFLLDPLVTNNADLSRLGRGEPLSRVTAFAVEASPEATACYANRLQIVVDEEAPIREP